MKTQRNRSKNISDEDIEATVRLLDGWVGKLTWENLIVAIDFRTGQHYTRQTLANHARIKLAYDVTKQRLSSEQIKEDKNSQSNDMLIQRVQRLENENMRLKKENDLFLAQFATWSYNAYIKGITIDELNKALPHVNRGQDVV